MENVLVYLNLPKWPSEILLLCDKWQVCYETVKDPNVLEIKYIYDIKCSFNVK